MDSQFAHFGAKVELVGLAGSEPAPLLGPKTKRVEPVGSESDIGLANVEMINFVGRAGDGVSVSTSEGERDLGFR